MNIFLNGETKEVPDNCSLSELVKSLNLREERLAVELNREVVRRKDWPQTNLSAGDKLEIVHFVGGG